MRQLFFAIIVLAPLLSIGLAFALDINGIVIDVLDGITLDVRVDAKDLSRDADILRVRLANLSAPHISTPEGLLAKEFTATALLNKSVLLFIQDSSSRGQNSSEIVPCIVYQTDSDGQPVYPSFNEILSKSGYAKDIDLQENDSDPINQWLKDIWLPETLKEPTDLLEPDTYEFNRINEPEPDLNHECPDCDSRACPPGKLCIM